MKQRLIHLLSSYGQKPDSIAYFWIYEKKQPIVIDFKKKKCPISYISAYLSCKDMQNNSNQQKVIFASIANNQNLFIFLKFYYSLKFASKTNSQYSISCRINVRHMLNIIELLHFNFKRSSDLKWTRIITFIKADEKNICK